MGNVYCKICDEPWDSYLDMSEWEKVLFKQGKGCPCCGERGESTVEWEAPEPTPVEGCECSHCGVKVAIDADGEAVWVGGERYHYHRGGAYSYGGNYGDEDAGNYADPEDWNEIGDEKFCPGCSQICWDCDAVLFKGNAAHDADYYSAGYPHPIGDYYSTRAICGDCHDVRSNESLQESLDSLEGCLPRGCELDPKVPEDWQSEVLQDVETHYTDPDNMSYVDEQEGTRRMIELGFVVCEDCGNTIRPDETVSAGEYRWSHFEIEHTCPTLAEELALEISC